MNRAEKFQTEIGVKIGMLRNEQSRGLSRVDWRRREGVYPRWEDCRGAHMSEFWATEERLVRHTPSATATTSDTGPHHLK